MQSTRERFGQIDPNDVTEYVSRWDLEGWSGADGRGDRLPAEYKALEARVDALNDLHKGMLKYVRLLLRFPMQLT